MRCQERGSAGITAAEHERQMIRVPFSSTGGVGHKQPCLSGRADLGEIGVCEIAVLADIQPVPGWESEAWAAWLRISSNCCCDANTSGIGPYRPTNCWMTWSLRADRPSFVGPLSAWISTLCPRSEIK